MPNKIKYGIKNVYYAVAGDDGYGTPVPIPGAVSIAMTPQGGREDFYADNILYFTSETNNGYTCELEVALVPESFWTDVLGNTLLQTSNVLVENADPKPVKFALGFQVEGDEKATKFWYYNCVAQRPNNESETKNDQLNIQTETLSITVAPEASGIVRAKTTATTPAETYDNWFQAVFEVA